MILQGDLKDFSLADLLQLLLQQRKTGTLLLVSEKEKAELAVSQGNIIGVRAGGATPETRIRDILVESGRISRSEMSDLEAVSVQMNRPLLQTLSAKGLLPEEERKKTLALASEDMVCDLFTWTEGKYEFGTSQKGLPPGMGHMRISTEFACMEGMRRIDEWPRLRERVPHDGMVFMRGDLPCNSEDEWERDVYALINGRLSLSDLVKRLPFGGFRLRECLVGLWDAGCIQPLEGLPLHAEAAAAADPRAERDQKTALLLGASALVLVGALVFRLVAGWYLESLGGDGIITPQVRVEGTTLRSNANALVLEHLSRTGSAPRHLGDLVKAGTLSGFETRGPEGAKLDYRILGEKDYILK